MSTATDKSFDRHKERRTATCRHFNGIQHDTCDAGVAYASVKDGPGCLPCLPPLREDRKCSKTCNHKSLYTSEELASQDREGEESLIRLMKARGAIVKATHGKRRVAGEIECPNCRGNLKYTVASSGHIWAACSTAGCARWIE